MRRLFDIVPALMGFILLLSASPELNKGQWDMHWVLIGTALVGLNLLMWALEYFTDHD